MRQAMPWLGNCNLPPKMKLGLNFAINTLPSRMRNSGKGVSKRGQRPPPPGDVESGDPVKSIERRRRHN